MDSHSSIAYIKITNYYTFDFELRRYVSIVHIDFICEILRNHVEHGVRIGLQQNLSRAESCAELATR